MTANLIPHRSLVLGVILPHTKIFGGVKRFFEIGNIFISRGHRFIVFTPDGRAPEWYPDRVPVKNISDLRHHLLDAIFLTETNYLNDFLRAPARLRIFYHVGPRIKLKNVLKQKDVVVFVNSTNMFDLDRKKYGIETVKALGGIHIPNGATAERSINKPFTVMAYGRLGRKSKGTALVVKACEKLYKKGYNVKLLLFDSPTDSVSEKKIRDFKCKVPFEFVLNHPVMENSSLYRRADAFVAAERKGGWSNTAAEALASGVALVGTPTGTKDFLIHNETGLLVWRHPYFIRKALEKLIRDPVLARRLGENGRRKIAEFDWEKLVTFIELYITSRLPQNQ